MQKWHTTNKEDTITTLLLKWMLTLRSNKAIYFTSFIVGNYTSAYSFIDMFEFTYNPGSYLENGSSEHIKFKEVLKESIEQLLESKKEFILSMD